MHKITKREKEIMLHALGFSKSDISYRNCFMTSVNSIDYPILEDLVKKQLMDKKPDPFDKGSNKYAYWVRREGVDMMKRIVKLRGNQPRH